MDVVLNFKPGEYDELAARYGAEMLSRYNDAQEFMNRIGGSLGSVLSIESCGALFELLDALNAGDPRCFDLALALRTNFDRVLDRKIKDDYSSIRREQRSAAQ